MKTKRSFMMPVIIAIGLVLSIAPGQAYCGEPTISASAQGLNGGLILLAQASGGKNSANLGSGASCPRTQQSAPSSFQSHIGTQLPQQGNIRTRSQGPWTLQPGETTRYPKAGEQPGKGEVWWEDGMGNRVIKKSNPNAGLGAFGPPTGGGQSQGQGGGQTYYIPGSNAGTGSHGTPPGGGQSQGQGGGQTYYIPGSNTGYTGTPGAMGYGDYTK